jgi:heat-inducible transcriptional repressor
MLEINQRQQELLILVIESFIHSAEPVGSKFLAYEEKIGWSEATIRNDLRALEEAGYLTHPHTSAGRVPTEAGYRFYVNSMDNSKIKLTAKDDERLERVLVLADEHETVCKSAAKEAAAISQNAVIIAFNLDKIYYTGFSYLFEKPEFINTEMVINTSRMFDQCEKCLGRFESRISRSPEIYIGSEHPFGGYLSATAMRLNNFKEGMFVILGPMRMDYKKNLAILNKIKNSL